MITLIIQGKVPSKKNAYLIGRGRLYLKQSVKDFIEYAIVQCVSIRNKRKLKTLEVGISVDMDFFTTSKADLDGMVTTILDVLQSAKIIKSDKDVIRIEATKEPSHKKKEDYTQVTLY